MKKERYTYFDRELSWLSFNARVLQEAGDPSVPLLERIKFLAIFSANLDEFFRVRVASLRSLLSLKKKSISKLDIEPRILLDAIRTTVRLQQEEFGAIFRDQILPELRAQGIVLLDEGSVTDAQASFLHTYFNEEIRPHLSPILLSEFDARPFLKNKNLYLAAVLQHAASHSESVTRNPLYALVNIPASLSRFTWVPGDDECQYVIFLDDVIRLNLPEIFPAYSVEGAFEIKLSRDAELHLEDEFSEDLIEGIKKGLKRRDVGVPCRLLYDHRAPHTLVRFLQERLGLEDEDLMPGARYHNFSDFLHFPRFGRDDLLYDSCPPLPHPELESAPSLLDAIAEEDRLISCPYQKFDYIIRFLEEAASAPDVEEIWMTLYRAGADSRIPEILIEAARRGKRVRVFIELKARFNEASNLKWTQRMRRAGVSVHYNLPGLKVHAKLALVIRREQDERRSYAYLGTGNFNEQTARIYADHGLFTADPRLTEEVRLVFEYIVGEVKDPTFQHLLVAPLDLRKGLYRLIEREIEHARRDGTGYMVVKLNSLEDRKIIDRLYAASNAGVKVRMIVRGINCLIPGVQGQSEHIHVTSIVDRFLEHARMYLFHNGGQQDLYLASADWMRRNLSERVEVAFPIYNPRIKKQLLDLLAIQIADNQKARIIDTAQGTGNKPKGDTPIRAQLETYRIFEQMAWHHTRANVSSGNGQTLITPYASAIHPLHLHK